MENKDKNIKIDKENAGVRLDVYLNKLNPDFTRSHFKNEIDLGNVLVNKKQVKAGYVLKENDVVYVKYVEPKTLDLTPEDIKLDIVYEDDDLLVLNKPQGMVVHPAVGNYNGTLVNALLYNVKNLSGINGVIRPGIVHRLDKDTSGLMVVAKNDKSHVELSRQIQTKECKRCYLALHDGTPKEDNGVIQNYLTRDNKNRLKYMVSQNNEGKFSESHYKVIAKYNGYSLIEWELKTGRTHQIRIHSAYINHPIVGDKLYNNNPCKFKIDGQLLHSYKLEFTHPTTKKLMKFEIELPVYFKKVIKILENK